MISTYTIPSRTSRIARPPTGFHFRPMQHRIGSAAREENSSNLLSRLETVNERTDDCLVELRAPWYVRLVGWILAAFGAVNLAALAAALPMVLVVGPSAVLEVSLFAVLPLVGGIGAIASRRWGWIVSLVAVMAGFLFGMVLWLFEGVVSPATQGTEVEWTWLTFLVLPGLAMLGALLAPATLRWLRAPSQAV
jgi:hypothetical protein